MSSEVLSWYLVAQANLCLVVVFFRMSYHHLGVLRGWHRWEDPVISKWIQSGETPRSPPAVEKINGLELEEEEV